MPESVRAFAPGRVNLIGEHTDYNDGLCLPFAVARGVTVQRAARAGGGRAIEVRALDLGEAGRFALDEDIRPPLAAPAHRTAGGASCAAPRPSCGATASSSPPCLLEIRGDLPRGAGPGLVRRPHGGRSASPSARSPARSRPSRIALARLCSRIENDWVRRPTGLLDQLASLFGERGQAVRIDMRALERRSGPARPRRPPARHARLGRLAQTRRLGLQRAPRGVPPAAAGARAALAARRRRRTSSAARAARAAACATCCARTSAWTRWWRRSGAATSTRAGALLDASHRSLRDDYEVSVPEVERTVEAAPRRPGALGARIMGGGFGGHVLALFPPDRRACREGAIAVRARGRARG